MSWIVALRDSWQLSWGVSLGFTPNYSPEGNALWVEFIELIYVLAWDEMNGTLKELPFLLQFLK